MPERLLTRTVLTCCVTAVLTACSAGTDPSTPDTLPAPTSSADASDSSSAGPAPLDPGVHAMAFFGATDEAPWAAIQVPAGWGLDRVSLATGADLDAHLRRIETSVVQMVASDPCEEAYEPVGPQVADLMAALAAQTSVRPARPRPTTLGGHDGQVLEVRVPADLDVADCGHGGTLVPWLSPGGAYTTVFPGWTYRVWAVDVDGHRLVVMGALGPDAIAAERSELTTMVETLKFVDAPST